MSVVRSILDYCAHIWHDNLTHDQTRDIERVQKRALRIILSGLSYEEALVECNLKTLKDRMEDMCTNLIKSLVDSCNILHDLLPPKVYIFSYCLQARRRTSCFHEH